MEWFLCSKPAGMPIVGIALLLRIGPKRRESITASGRAPMVKMSRRIPPTPVVAP